MNWYFGDQQENRHRLLGHSHLERLKNSGGWRQHAWRGAETGGLGDAFQHFVPRSARRGCRVSAIPREKPYVAETTVKDEGGRETICLQSDAKHLTFLTCATRLTKPSDICHSMSWILDTAIHISHIHPHNRGGGEKLDTLNYCEFFMLLISISKLIKHIFNCCNLLA